MVMSAASMGGMSIIWFMLLFASAGVFHHAGIKIPFFTFFSHDSGIRTKEAPLNMLIAMGIAAFLCIFIGTFPNYSVYQLLPYTDVVYHPYTGFHVMAQTELLFFSALAFTLLILAGIYPSEIRAVNLDADLIYRKGSKLLVYAFTGIAAGIANFLNYIFVKRLPENLAAFSKKPIIGLMDMYMSATGKENPGAKCLIGERKPELVNLVPAGVPVLIAVAFLSLLAFFFMK